MVAERTNQRSKVGRKIPFSMERDARGEAQKKAKSDQLMSVMSL